MVKKKTLDNSDLIKCFDKTGHPFLVTFEDFKKLFKQETTKKETIKNKTTKK